MLNLDAEHELEARGSFTPARRLEAIVRAQARRLVGRLVGEHDVILDPRTASEGRAQGLTGVAWSPTPRARAVLEQAGARVVEAPDVAVLRRVNARPFAAGVRRPLVEGGFAKDVAADLAEGLALLARPAADGWLVRRTFGAAGRGRRRLASGVPSDAERAWLEASLRLGPLVIEPWVTVTEEFTRCGLVEREGRVVVAAPGVQRTTSEGAWVDTRSARASEIGRPHDARLEEACVRAGEALAAAGYFGPYGVDAFTYRDAQGERLNPLSEINARYTMDWVDPRRP